MKTVGKPLNRFVLLQLNKKTKAKAVKPDTKTNTNLHNIKNLKNELIRAELCRTRSVCVRNTGMYQVVTPMFALMLKFTKN